MAGKPNNDPGNINDGKKAVLEKALDDITKRFGDGSIIRLGEARHLEVAAISTGSLSLDIALGVGGIPPRACG
jgi:recombination protein RecA